MKTSRLLYRVIFFAAILVSFPVFAQRQDVLLNDNWSFRFSYGHHLNAIDRLDLPHTWNAQDALSGDTKYKRGIGTYEKKLFAKSEWEGKRIFLRFEGAFKITDVFVNGLFVGEHRGGYGAFVFEITDCLKYGEENLVTVRVNNSECLDVMPLTGDFNFYGGIYRDVHLLITEPACISPLDYASPGVRLVQENVSSDKAEVRAVVDLSNSGAANGKFQLNLRVSDSDTTVKEISKDLTLGSGESVQELSFTIDNPHLWNGRKDPFMYKVCVSLLCDGKEVDCVQQPLGLRYFSVDPEKGFFLNGEHLALHGVCRHQDRSEIGNALRKQHHEEDAAIMVEMGVNAVRLAHYPQAEYFYELMDKYGIVAWAEIPFVGPGGYSDKGFVDLPSFKENGREQLIEMIRQHYNHPSICFWGIFNELNEIGDNPVSYLRELNELAHNEDTTRPTTSASCVDAKFDMNFVSDVTAWNKYYGWYGGMPEDLGVWLDKTHADYPSLRLAISEYGAGASIYQQQDSLAKPKPNGWWHPENWQTYYHIENWKAISSRPYVWGSFVWNMFDFGIASRTEGDRPGINDKGLVTFDRKVKKDAFYFYKANWNTDEPVLYICGRRNVQRSASDQTITVFCNLPEVELFVNGVSCGKVSPDEYSVAKWDVTLQKGENKIEAVSVSKENTKGSDTIMTTFL